jgi:D-xylose transport system permease protein
VLGYWVMGAMIVVQRVPAFIITLGGMLVFRGLHWLVIANATIPVTRGGVENIYSSLTTFHLSPVAGYVMAGIVVALLSIASFIGYRSQTRAGVAPDGEAIFLRTFITAQVILLLVIVCNGYQGVPLPMLILGVVAAIVTGITRHTPFGRYLYAIGGNEEAAIVSGVPVTAVTIAAFAAMGFLAAITGLLQTAYSGASTTTVGVNMELDAIAACVIGGTSLKGGRGTVGGVLLGALVMAVLINGMTLMAYGPEAKYILRGVVLAVAVWADVRLGKH